MEEKGVHGSPIIVAIRKDEAMTLPRMGATDANIIRITGGDFPTRRDVNRLPAICDKRAIVNFVTVKRDIKVGAIALQGWGWGGGVVSLSERVCRGQRSQAKGRL